MYPEYADNHLEHELWSDASLPSLNEQPSDVLQYFGFRELPFGVTPNPDFLFSSRMHLAAFESMVQSIESNLGFTVLLGEPGMGKTTLLQQLLARYHSARTAYVFQTQCTRYDLIRYLASELEVPIRKRDEVSLHHSIEEMLVNEARARRKVLIIIDEAQNLQPPSLEAIRLLSDFETTNAKLLHIVLAGSAQLSETLLAPELSPLAQRIATVCRLSPLNNEDVRAYVFHRLEVAGYRDPEYLFTPESLASLAQYSNGIPRVLNSLCNRSLSIACNAGERRVTLNVIKQAVRDMDLSRLDANGSADNQRRPALPRLVIPVTPPQPRARDFSARETQPAPQSQPDPQAANVEDINVGNLLSAKMDSAKINLSKMEVEQPPVSTPPATSFPETSPVVTKSDRAPWINSQVISGATILKFFGQKGAHAPTLNLSRQRGRLAQALNDRRTGFAVAVLTVLALALLASWYGFRASSGGVRDSLGAKSVVGRADSNGGPANTRSAWLFDVFADSTASSGISSTPNAAERKIASRRTASQINTLPQNAIASKLRPAASSAIETAGPGTMSLAKASGDVIPSLASAHVAVPAPTLEKRAILDKVMADVSAAAVRRPIKTVPPEYPRLAKVRGVQGDVVLQLQIDSNGKVTKVTPVTGNSLLSQAAEEAVRQWQYPPSGNQDSAPVVTQVRISFKMTAEGK